MTRQPPVVSVIAIARVIANTGFARPRAGCALFPWSKRLSHLSEAQILRFLAQLTLLLLVSRTLGDLMKRLGQAPVIGELLAGVIVGPSVLGNLAPDLFAACFGGDPMSRHLLEAFAWTGAILLLLYIGLETDLDILAARDAPPPACRCAGW